MHSEDDLLPLSALQHLVFCERQCALIHIERVWQDNALTIEGTHLHTRVDDTAPRREVRGDVVILRGLALRSLVLGLVGRADVVELHRRRELEGAPSGGDALPLAIAVSGLPGLWSVAPVEYKRGQPKANSCDEVQLCAQALCLEEMLGVRIAEGALFYGRRQRRNPVCFGGELASATRDVAARLHTLVGCGKTPRAQKEPKCEKCSLLAVCMPEAMTRRRSASHYLEHSLRDLSLGLEDAE